jgi:DNA polymerase III subunit delta'
MSFSSFTDNLPVVQILQRSLYQGRLSHAYLFRGNNLADLEDAARALAQTLNCYSPNKPNEAQLPLDCCDTCQNCQRIRQFNHPDIYWIRPESKSRIITIEQIRDLLQSIHLKPMEAAYKFAILVAADRLNAQAANAFLKTLEEPPPQSCIILLSTQPQDLLETIVSRCLRLDFLGESICHTQAGQIAWLTEFSNTASGQLSTLLDRYKLLGILTVHLASIKTKIEEDLKAQSSLDRFPEVDSSLKEKWEDELTAAIEAEYRRQRSDVFATLLGWLRDIWILGQGCLDHGLLLPQLAQVSKVIAQRITAQQAIDNVKTVERAIALLETNVQEALVLEVSLIKLSF